MATWNGLEGGHQPIRYVYMDLANEYDRFAQMLKDERPDTLVHFAEQRAAPYSMKNAACKRYTIENNLGATHNVLCAIVESGLDIHLVHLGTMGVCTRTAQKKRRPTRCTHTALLPRASFV